MSAPINDYALISNRHTAALVSRAGGIDWFCPARFDSPACFAALLGNEQHGCWLLAPRDRVIKVERQYQLDSLVLETTFTTETGSVRITDAMPLGQGCHIVRIVEGLSGEVAMKTRCSPRLDYGREPPRVDLTPDDGGEGCVLFEWENERLALHLRGEAEANESGVLKQEFTVTADQQRCFVLSYAAADRPLRKLDAPARAVAECAAWWQDWAGRCQYRGRWEKTVRRSLITLKALTYEPSGAMIAAATTSLPEIPGGPANYDYRYCWLRDAAFALRVFMNSGYRTEACNWRDWLLKAVHQHDMPMHTLYTVDATTTPEERELHWLPGHDNSRPVREGNAASHQYQLDLRGEIMEVFHTARCYGLDLSDDIWDLQCEILEYLEERWHQPDRGIWEFREILDQLTHSKVWCWVAFDRCIRDAENYGLDGPVDHWRQVRDEIREDIFEHGVHPEGGYFTQRYGADEVDASLLMIPLVGFLPADDPRMQATVAQIERDLCEDGLVRRYRTGDSANREGMFLPCSFWLADNYWLSGRHEDARQLFERTLELCNDVGLLSEEYSTETQQLLGNFPQGLTHLALISTARLIATADAEDAELT